MSRIVYDPFRPAQGPEWTLWAAGALFLLVLTVSVLLTVYFNRRDGRILAHIQDVTERWSAARLVFMRTVDGLQSGQYRSLGVLAVAVGQADASCQAFLRAQAHSPDLEPDADWLNSLKWVEEQGKRAGFLRGDR